MNPLPAAFIISAAKIFYHTSHGKKNTTNCLLGKRTLMIITSNILLVQLISTALIGQFFITIIFHKWEYLLLVWLEQLEERSRHLCVINLATLFSAVEATEYDMVPWSSVTSLVKKFNLPPPLSPVSACAALWTTCHLLLLTIPIHNFNKRAQSCDNLLLHRHLRQYIY